LDALVECLATRVNEESAYLISRKMEDCGVVRVNLATALRRADPIIFFDGDSLAALSTDGTQGILIDYTADDEKRCYEVAVWGDRWSLSAFSCGSS
jgi:hypothetical protein